MYIKTFVYWYVASVVQHCWGNSSHLHNILYYILGCLHRFSDTALSMHYQKYARNLATYTCT